MNGCMTCPRGADHPGRCALPTLPRLMRNIDQSAGPDGCWPWTGNANERGYGETYLWLDGRKVRMKASRAVYVATHGPLSPDIFILHSCDNPPCCNLAHLRPGTHLENMHDRKTRGAGYPRGAENHNTVLVSEETVAAIRAAYRRNVPGSGAPALAVRYGLGRGVVQAIVTRKGRWSEAV